VARRSDPERTFQARKAAAIERLVSGGIPRDRVHAWIESYEGGDADVHRARADPAAFWESAYRFARGEFDRGHMPPPLPDASSDVRDPRQ
jgi:hypothetical protein